jgi:hypothetical protein
MTPGTVEIRARKIPEGYQLLAESLREAVKPMNAAKWEIDKTVDGRIYALKGSDALVFPGQDKGVIHAAHLRLLCKVIEDDIIELRQTDDGIVILYNGYRDGGQWHYDSRATLKFTGWRQYTDAVLKRVEFVL